MSIEATRCHSCGNLPYVHSSLTAGIRKTFRKDGKWENEVVCTMYSPSLRGKRIVFTGFWNRFQKPLTEQFPPKPRKNRKKK